jgi:hypothetical protein
MTLMVFTSGGTEANKADAIPAIFLIEDFLATDWKIVL